MLPLLYFVSGIEKWSLLNARRFHFRLSMYVDFSHTGMPW
jgi:hypothetical protein